MVEGDFKMNEQFADFLGRRTQTDCENDRRPGVVLQSEGAEGPIRVEFLLMPTRLETGTAVRVDWCPEEFFPIGIQFISRS